MSYPNGIPMPTATGNPFIGNTFTPLDNTRAIRDNYTAVDKASLTNTLGYAVSMLQNFVNSTYLGRSGCYIQDGYIASGHFSGVYIGTPIYGFPAGCVLGTYAPGGSVQTSNITDWGGNFIQFYGNPSYPAMTWFKFDATNASLELTANHTIKVGPAGAIMINNTAENTISVGSEINISGTDTYFDGNTHSPVGSGIFSIHSYSHSNETGIWAKFGNLATFSFQGDFGIQSTTFGGHVWVPLPYQAAKSSFDTMYAISYLYNNTTSVQDPAPYAVVPKNGNGSGLYLYPSIDPSGNDQYSISCTITYVTA